MSRVALYTELYKRFDNNLTDEEISKAANYAASVKDQQSVINHLYKNYTGEEPSFEQRLEITKFVDPQSVNNIIKSENARRQAAYEEQVKLQKAKKLQDEKDCVEGSECAKLKAEEDEKKRIQGINDEFDANFIGGKNSKDPDYLRLKDADPKEKALYLK